MAYGTTEKGRTGTLIRKRPLVQVQVATDHRSSWVTATAVLLAARPSGGSRGLDQYSAKVQRRGRIPGD
jgi:hypothetical protein